MILQWLKEPELNFPPQEVDMKKVGVCVGQIHQKAQLTQSTISEYLSVLQRTGLIESTRIGQWTYYKRNEAACQELKRLLETSL